MFVNIEGGRVNSCEIRRNHCKKRAENGYIFALKIVIHSGAVPRPGEVSLAHHGVLFLDELPEFDRSVLEVLRQPLEDQKLTISRAAMALTFPASLMLAAAMNACRYGVS